MVLRFFMLAGVFLCISCTDFERNNPNDPGSKDYRGYQIVEPPSIGQSSGSSSVESSSSSEAVPNSSSSNLPSSSSYVEPSSSSAAVFSSSTLPSSSSSATVPSSSSKQSSSSIGCTAANNTSTQYCSNGTMKEYGFVTDNDGKTYKTVEIGEQIWMAENLNYNANGSKCYLNEEANCDIYGRLYDWATAMALPSSCNDLSSCSVNAKHQGICPSGWHLPSLEEWKTLMIFVGTDRLKATSGWSYSSGNGQDTYGFAALPGGDGTFRGSGDGKFRDIDDGGNWWSATEIANSANCMSIYYVGYYYNKNNSCWLKYWKSSDLLSVRCVKD